MKEAFVSVIITVGLLFLIIVPTYNIGKEHGGKEVYKRFTSLCSDKVGVVLDREFVELEFSCKIKEKK